MNRRRTDRRSSSRKDPMLWQAPLKDRIGKIKGSSRKKFSRSWVLV